MKELGYEPAANLDPAANVAAVRGAVKIQDTNVPSNGHIVLREFPQPDIDKLWRDFLSRVEAPGHYNSPEFFRAPYWEGQNPFAILVLNSNRITGAATGLDLGSEVTCGLISRPQVCIEKGGDPAGPSEALAKAFDEAFPSAKLITLYAWSWTPLPGLLKHDFRMMPLEGDVVLDLRPGAEFLFEHFLKNRRRDIRIAIRNSVEVSEVTTSEDLEAYWQVNLTWHQSERKEIHHQADFGDVQKTHRLRSNYRRFLARYKGEPIAASGVRFYPNGLIEYAGNCSRDKFLSLCPNDLLLWRIIEWACEHRFPAFSLGGAHPFLRKWGGVVVPINRYRLDRTFGHRIELKEDMERKGRQLFRTLPASLQTTVRKYFKK